jgi:hypothetical protein
MSEEQRHEDLSFAEVGLLAVDRAMRMMEQLREQLRSADEYLLRARAADKGAVLLETITLENKHVQSISVQVRRDHGGRSTVIIAHRGEPGMITIPAGSTMEFEV